MTTHESFELTAIGEPLVEFNQGRGAADTYVRGFGGDTSNCAIAAARLGTRTQYVTRVGDDTFGRLLIDLWRREGIDIRFVATEHHAPTGVYFVTHTKTGHEFSYLRTGSAASLMSPATLPLHALRSTKVLHVSGISQAISGDACDAVFAAIETARGAGACISYDPNLRLKLWPLHRARAIIRATIPLCDWFLPSLDEAQQLSGFETPESILDWCRAEGAPLVALKAGEAGAWLSTGSARDHVPGHRVQCVDTTGAGDCFDGAFIARMVAGDGPLAAGQFANAAAALKTLGYGAVNPLPRYEDVTAFLKRAG